MESLCRLCGSDEGIRVSIFESGTEHVKKIHKILPITINEHDPLPKTMCHRCSFKVNEFFEFRTKCIKAQEMFKSNVPWLRDKQSTYVDKGHPPMVEVPLNSVNSVSPNEKQIPTCQVYVDENNSPIVIEDDSPPYQEDAPMVNSVLNEYDTQEKIIMKIKRSDLRKKSKSRSIWETKKRKKKKTYRIAEVFTTSVDEYQGMNDIENDPLRFSPIDHNSMNDYLFRAVSPKNEHNNGENGILTSEKTVENIIQPNHILVTNIPRVGLVYTCEKCGRTFLSPQPASLHVCDDVECNKVIEPIEGGNETSDFYNCNLCDQVFTRHSQLVTHQKRHVEKESSSDDNFTPFNKRKKLHKKRKDRPSMLRADSFHLSSNDSNEHEITRHSLLSSDSE